ncbi:hypothetical protein [Marinicellulosiphila megalodicopiae]|uniref:hypothetical protein n=1 Tax=Marinicellulosiphila megalodicopiae TaxID=2724896 RepID=UPI003BB1F19D
MFWLRQLCFFICLYIILSIGLNQFIIIPLNQSLLLFHLLIAINLIFLVVWIYGVQIIKQCWDTTFISIKSLEVDKEFIITCAKMYYAKGALSLESMLKNNNDPFVQKAIHLVVDQVSVSQFETELTLAIQNFNRKLIQAKLMLVHLIGIYLFINILYSLFLNLIYGEILSELQFINWLYFLIIICGLLFPIYFQISLYQKHKIDSYLIYQLGFKSILNQMSSRQVELAISNA